MSKSVWSILGIGAAGLILLSLMMQHLAESVVERARSPYAAAVETRLGSKRVGRVRIDKAQDTLFPKTLWSGGEKELEIVEASVEY